MRSSRIASGSFSCCAGLMLRPRMGGFCCLNERRKSSGVVRGHVRQDFAIQFDSGLLEAADELAVRDFAGSACGSYTDDPKRTKIALLPPPPDKTVAQRFLNSLLRGPIELALGKK